MNKLEIFIAGSKALEEERSWVRTVASNIVAEYHRKGVVMHYAIYDYTNFDLTFDTNGQQENYNKYIAKQADLVIFILDKTIGDKTIGEFDVAYNAYSTKRRPRICIFSKKHNAHDANIDKIREKVTRLNQYYNEYETREQLERMVDRLLRDYSDSVIAKNSRRKNTKTLLWVVAVAIIAILGVLAYAFNGVPKVLNEATPTSVVQSSIESNSVVVAEKPTVKSSQAQNVEANKSVSQPNLVLNPPPPATQTTTKNETPTVKSTPVQKVEANKSVSQPKSQPKAAQSTTKNAAPVTTAKTEVSTQNQTQQAPQPKPSLRAKANSGDLASCYELAVKLQNEDGLTKNLGEAYKYMKVAAEGGYSKAYRPLAEMYHKGAGVAKNRDIAAKWYQKAAENGDRKALYILNNL